MGNKEVLVKHLFQYDEQVLSLAIMYATNYCKYGVDVTEKWETAVQQQCSLERAFRDGYSQGRESVFRIMQEHNGCECIKGRRMTDAESMGMLFDDAPNID